MKNLILSIAVLFTFQVKSQIIKEWGIGAEAMYNIPIKGFGVGVRSHLHLSDRWFLSPQVSYYPGWNQVVEWYYGADLNFNLMPETKWGAYLAAGPYYNRWSNFASSEYSKAKLNNFSAELGGGFVKNHGCFRPFIEYRANSKWWESNLRLGFNVYFSGCKSGEIGRDGFRCPPNVR